LIKGGFWESLGFSGQRRWAAALLYQVIRRRRGLGLALWRGGFFGDARAFEETRVLRAPQLETAARILGRKTDIMTRRSLHPVLRKGIAASALQIF
jgi:hypothetical protein